MSILEKRRTNKTDPHRDLEQRAVDALTGEEKVSSEDIAALIREVEEAIAAAEDDAKEAMIAAHDPLITRNGAAALNRLQAADLRVKRLCTLLERLEAGYRQVVHHEAVEAWLPSYEAARERRDKVAAEFKKVYLDFTEKLAPILEEIDAVNRECYRVNDCSPGTTGRYLEGVEETARGHGPSMLAALHLPSWELHGAPLWRGRAR
jgi:hypothetical protein